MNVKISIIVPVYNTEKYLRRCLDSVLKQNLKDIELIVVNDCSPDNSLSIIHEYMEQDRRIVLINKEVNAGLSAARNSGLKIARGEYILHIDSDDWVEANYFFDVYNYAKTHEADIVITNYIKDDDKGSIRECVDQRTQENIELNKQEILENICLFKSTPAVWNKLISRKLYIEYTVLHPQGISMGEDIFAILKLLYFSNKTVKLSHAYYHYILNNNSLMKAQNTNNDNLKDIYYVVNDLKNFCANKDVDVSINELFITHISIWIYNTRYDFKDEEFKKIYYAYQESLKKVDLEKINIRILKNYIKIQKRLNNKWTYIVLWQFHDCCKKIKEIFKNKS